MINAILLQKTNKKLRRIVFSYLYYHIVYVYQTLAYMLFFNYFFSIFI